ncbi:MAG: hypothetical protein GEEBNDBF_00652 [bacterium]|nr:hypothetical protein [bacterium]
MASRPGTTHPLRILRLAQDLTQAELATRAGVSRTAISAIEQQTLVPSVTAALALAEALATTVEQLFGVSPQPAGALRWAWAPTYVPSRYWQAEVAGQYWCFPADADVSSPWLAGDGIAPDGHIPTTLLPVATQTLVIATCDPLAVLLAEEYRRQTNGRLLILRRSSNVAAHLLQEGLVHGAGLHLATDASPESNAARLTGSKDTTRWSLVPVARWEAGIALGGRAQDSSLSDLKSSNLRWVAREPGSGAFSCLQEVVAERRRFRLIAPHHEGVALAIRSGWADAGPCLRLTATQSGLAFCSVRTEHYDLACSDTTAQDPRWQGLLRVLRSPEWRSLAGFPGIDTRSAGAVREVLA